MDREERAAQVLACTDWTTLSFTETEADLERMLAGAQAHRLAACCIPREWLGWWTEHREGQELRVATVLNFPGGNSDLAQIEAEAQAAAHAEEWDVVLPYTACQNGDEGPARELLAAVRAWSGERTLKIILETGSAWSRKGLQRAAELALEARADFLKTSTGKVPLGATHEAVAQLLEVLQGTGAGLKVSGGIRSLDAAFAYLDQIEAAMGRTYLQPATLRFGTSTLLLP